MTTKTCFKCKIKWPLHYYYKHNQMKDGHLNKCKKCSKKDAMDHRANNIEKCREYDRERFQTEHRKKYHTKKTKEHRLRHPEKYKARTWVSNALRDRRLIKQACCVCGSLNSTAHHEDYNKPMEVVWVCQKHHRELE